MIHHTTSSLDGPIWITDQTLEVAYHAVRWLRRSGAQSATDGPRLPSEVRIRFRTRSLVARTSTNSDFDAVGLRRNTRELMYEFSCIENTLVRDDCSVSEEEWGDFSKRCATWNTSTVVRPSRSGFRSMPGSRRSTGSNMTKTRIGEPGSRRQKIAKGPDYQPANMVGVLMRTSHGDFAITSRKRPMRLLTSCVLAGAGAWPRQDHHYALGDQSAVWSRFLSSLVCCRSAVCIHSAWMKDAVHFPRLNVKSLWDKSKE